MTPVFKFAASILYGLLNFLSTFSHFFRVIRRERRSGVEIRVLSGIKNRGYINSAPSQRHLFSARSARSTLFKDISMSAQKPASPEPFTITVQSRVSEVELCNGELVIKLPLGAGYVFDKPNYARLLAVTGLAEPVIVFATFVASVPVDSSYRRLLGLSSALPGSAALVENNRIPALSQVILAKQDGSVFVAVPTANFLVHIQVAQAEWMR